MNTNTQSLAVDHSNVYYPFCDNTKAERDQKALEPEDYMNESDGDFYVRMHGDAMDGAGVKDNDLLIASAGTQPEDGAIVVAILEGEIIVRRIFRLDDRICLTPENVNYPAIEVRDDEDVNICGVVTKIIHSLR